MPPAQGIAKPYALLGCGTIFAADGEDFVRVTTSVKKENGERAVGAHLDRKSPAYAALRAGRTQVGLATLFGKQYITQYEPARDASGKVVAGLYVGVAISEDMKVLKDRIRAIKVGDTGYFHVLDAAPGKAYGGLIVHPAKEGSNLLENKDADGSFFVKEILEKKQGAITYDWQNPGEASARQKFVAYTHIKDWNWIIAGGTYRDEITAASQEQTAGIEHVNRSVGAMDEATRQNAALVEEAGAAAQAMQGQAAELARAVRLFRPGEEAAPAALAAPARRQALLANSVFRAARASVYSSRPRPRSLP